MDCITWEAARAYCRSRNGDLPTEAQWEKAARGTDQRDHPWGNGSNLASVIDEDHLVDVGTTPDRSPYGAQEMGSNALEWVRDYYVSNYYQHSPSKDPFNDDPMPGDFVVIRGTDGLTWYRARTSVTPGPKEIPGVGFRCAYDAGSPGPPDDSVPVDADSVPTLSIVDGWIKLDAASGCTHPNLNTAYEVTTRFDDDVVGGSLRITVYRRPSGDLEDSAIRPVPTDRSTMGEFYIDVEGPLMKIGSCFNRWDDHQLEINLQPTSASGVQGEVATTTLPIQ